jgi:hypothetical protein
VNKTPHKHFWLGPLAANSAHVGTTVHYGCSSDALMAFS